MKTKIKIFHLYLKTKTETVNIIKQTVQTLFRVNVITCIDRENKLIKA